MAERDETQRVQVGLRMREWLRERLETEAKRHDVSLNTEITARVETTLRDEELGGTIFRDRATYVLLDEFARLLRFTEHNRGKRWTEDRPTLLLALRIFQRLVEMAPKIMARDFPESLRDMTNQIAFAELERLIEEAEERPAKRSRS
jgi:hypothetical protein